MTKTTHSPLAAMCRGLMALVASALVLAALSYIFMWTGAPEGVGNTYSKTIQGKQFNTVMGTTQVENDSLVVTNFQAHDNQEHALISMKSSFRAENYAFVAYHFQNWKPGMRINFIWRTASNPRGLLTTPLHASLKSPGTFDLTREKNWRGSITEIGLHIIGGEGDQPLKVMLLELKPSGWGTMLASLWTEWTAFRGWTPRSINYLYGSPLDNGRSPVAALAAWSGLGLLILLGLGVIKWKPDAPAVATVIILPWITLDLLWQSELHTQGGLTKQLFHNKSTHEKHLVDSDRHIYTYTARLKRQILPETPARIFILSQAEGHDFKRLKTQYYLLPHNIYNVDKVPPQWGPRPADYILLLDQWPQLTFDADSGHLLWGQTQRLPVEHIDQDPMGTLFRVLASAPIQ